MMICRTKGCGVATSPASLNDHWWTGRCLRHSSGNDVCCITPYLGSCHCPQPVEGGALDCFPEGLKFCRCSPSSEGHCLLSPFSSILRCSVSHLPPHHFSLCVHWREPAEPLSRLERQQPCLSPPTGLLLLFQYPRSIRRVRSIAYTKGSTEPLRQIHNTCQDSGKVFLWLMSSSCTEEEHHR